MLAVFTRFGCAHFQIGRTYPYKKSLDAAAWGLVENLKSYLDPAGALNPGVLGPRSRLGRMRREAVLF